MQERVFKTENIEVLFEHNTIELYGTDMGLEGVRLLYRMGQPEECERDIKIDGFFLAIGHHPNSEVFKDYIHIDEQGYIITEGTSTYTNVPGCLPQGMLWTPYIARVSLLPEPVAGLPSMPSVISWNWNK